MKLYKIGSKGRDVVQIQRLSRNSIQMVCTVRLPVRQFWHSSENGLAADGVVGPAALVKAHSQRFPKSKRKINEIIIHCSDTEEGCNFTAADIRRWHGKRDRRTSFMHGPHWRGH